MHDETIDYLFSIPSKIITLTNPSFSTESIKLHSKRGIVGKAFTNNEIVVADWEEEIKDMMELEEKKMEIIWVTKIVNVVAIPIESEQDEKVHGVLMMYNIELPNNNDRLSNLLQEKWKELDIVVQNFSNLIEHNSLQKSNQVLLETFNAFI